MGINNQDTYKISSASGSYRDNLADGIFAHSETSQGNGADTTDDVLFTAKVPAYMLQNPGSSVLAEAWGDTAANGNNKQIKVWVGTDVQTLGAAIVSGATTLIASSGTVTTNNGGWKAEAEVVSYGNVNANTQRAFGSVLSGVTTGAVSSEKTVALTQTENADMYITVTGASGTTGAANDVVGKLFRLSLKNA